MNQKKLWSVVALSTTVVGIPSVGRAATTDGNSPTQPPTPNGDAVNVEKSPSTTAKLGSRTVEVTQVHTHNLAGRQATTLYVRNIPFLTFVSEQGTEKANAIAAKINQLISDKVDGSQITVSQKVGRYVIRVNGEELVEIDGNTRLPDTTNNLSQDALQATNRLRRLISGTRPLSEVVNIPGQQEVPKQVQQTVKPAEQTVKKPQQTVKKPEQATKKSEQNTAKKVRSSGKGMASFYGYGDSSRTSTGERFNPEGLTAAHRTLPFGTKVRVTNTGNGRSVVVRINDRGPFIRGRVIDVSLGAAKRLGMISSGVASVQIEVLEN
ncbi:MAG: septal ring lytic transglycosylase RlpA family protein [Cyanomargarita calcarea GSE-NOS-MK-12-04C]|jgi:rare lipoprotein A|uniref:Probable endolytic peptidoglycan transglycosylase RlpA n=1 Tax=Cyanomargarita calcarea GSE-NOS-MK-12-04C TaxID=2839659 RepID=A0A951UV97_9CYAN|nr:septal ring lytic transglycosylase RlpA family protein [Cyanomargarita calcarea GSE-NOS-MK-12-04C]